MSTNERDIVARVLREAKTIAVIGASANPARASYEVAAFLRARGHRVIAVNPGLAGQTLHGETVYAHLADVPAPVDMVDLFRNSDVVGQAIDEAIAEKDRLGLKFVWTQLDVIDHAAARRAENAGLTVVMDRCPKIEYARLGL